MSFPQKRLTSYNSKPRSNRLRVTKWQDSESIALVSPPGQSKPVTSQDIISSVQKLHAQGIQRCVTPALTIQETEPFYQAGFVLHQRLHLLSLDLEFDYALEAVQPKHISIRPGRRWHQQAVLQLDSQAFDEFWQFNRSTLHQAQRATPACRYRVSLDDNQEVVGYAITGRAGRSGYLQRLAVDPSHQGKGIGTSLVLDALDWLYRKGTKQVLVNTQDSNTRAFGLYKHLGFTVEPEGLVVLRWDSPS